MESENIKALLDYIPEEIERLARIERATEKVFEKKHCMLLINGDDNREFVTVDGLLEWAESEN